MSRVRVCFCGTPQFAVTSLQKVLDDPHYEVVGVVTQPDRPAGRKMLLTPSPVKSLALARGLRVISPEKINQDLILQEIQSWGAEVAIVVAFGQILSQKFLNLFPFGAVNVHGSLLPKWRGAAPIQRSLEAGDSQTGVALQKIVKELDAGDVLGVRKLDVDPNMNAQELHDKLAILGADLLHVELMDFLRGNLAAVPQVHSEATYAKKIDKTEAEIDWSLSAQRIHNKIRAFFMGPGVWTQLILSNKEKNLSLKSGSKIKIHRSRLCQQIDPELKKLKMGELFWANVKAPQVLVQTGDGPIEILEIQPESRNKMAASDFLVGILNQDKNFDVKKSAKVEIFKFGKASN